MTARDSYDQAVIDAARAVVRMAIAIATGTRPPYLPLDRLTRAIRAVDGQPGTRRQLLGPFQVASVAGCRVAVEPLNPDTDDRAVLWLHDEGTRRMAATHLPAHGLRALGQHLIRCADQIDRTPPREDTEPPCPTPSQSRPPWSSPRTSSSPA